MGPLRTIIEKRKERLAVKGITENDPFEVAALRALRDETVMVSIVTHSLQDTARRLRQAIGAIGPEGFAEEKELLAQLWSYAWDAEQTERFTKMCELTSKIDTALFRRGAEV